MEMLPTTTTGLGEIQTLSGFLIYEFLRAFTKAEKTKVKGAKIYSQKLLLYHASIR